MSWWNNGNWVSSDSETIWQSDLRYILRDLTNAVNEREQIISEDIVTLWNLSGGAISFPEYQDFNGLCTEDALALLKSIKTRVILLNYNFYVKASDFDYDPDTDSPDTTTEIINSLGWATSDQTELIGEGYTELIEFPDALCNGFDFNEHVLLADWLDSLRYILVKTDTLSHSDARYYRTYGERDGFGEYPADQLGPNAKKMGFAQFYAVRLPDKYFLPGGSGPVTLNYNYGGAASGSGVLEAPTGSWTLPAPTLAAPWSLVDSESWHDWQDSCSVGPFYANSYLLRTSLLDATDTISPITLSQDYGESYRLGVGGGQSRDSNWMCVRTPATPENLEPLMLFELDGSYLFRPYNYHVSITIQRNKPIFNLFDDLLETCGPGTHIDYPSESTHTWSWWSHHYSYPTINIHAEEEASFWSFKGTRSARTIGTSGLNITVKVNGYTDYNLAVSGGSVLAEETFFQSLLESKYTSCEFKLTGGMELVFDITDAGVNSFSVPSSGYITSILSDANLESEFNIEATGEYTMPNPAENDFTSDAGLIFNYSQGLVDFYDDFTYKGEI